MKVQSCIGLRVLVLPLVVAILAGNVVARELEEEDFVTLLSSAGELEIVRHPPLSATAAAPSAPSARSASQPTGAASPTGSAWSPQHATQSPPRSLRPP